MSDGYGERQETPDTFTSEERQIFTAIPGSIFEPQSYEPLPTALAPLDPAFIERHIATCLIVRPTLIVD